MKTCRICHTQQGPFKGARCRACYNATRRERYQWDPQHRLKRKQQVSREKHAEYMRLWRARKKQAEEQEVS